MLILRKKKSENIYDMKFGNYKKTGLFVFFSFFSCVLIYSATHVVQKGETLYSISKKYSITVQSLCDANKIEGTDIKIGQKLVIPSSLSEQKSVTENTVGKSDSNSENPGLSEKTPAVKTDSASSEKATPGSYTVQKGDTWYGIARANSISVAELYALNGVDSSATLKSGQKIKVPEKKSDLTSAVASSDGKNSSATAVAAKTNEKSVGATSAVAASAMDLQKADPHNYSTKKGDSSLVWPVESPEVTYVNGKVSGVSLSAKQNESVTAIMSGTVMFSGSYRGFGNVVFIQSKTGHIYAYTGLGKVIVSKGDYIDYKSQIGTAGIDSYSAKPQVSLMVFQNGLPIDPAKAPRG